MKTKTEIHGVVALMKKTDRWTGSSGEVAETVVTLTAIADDGTEHEFVLLTKDPQDPAWGR